MTKIINKMILFAVCAMAMSLSAKDELPGGLKRAEWMHASMYCPKCDGPYCAYYDRSIPGSCPTACPKCSGKKDEGCIYPGDLYRQAQRALRKGNISEALAYLEKSAANGNAEAQFDLGCFHAQGEYGLKADIKKAVYYWTLAARNNHADAQRNLGDCYMAGDGVKQNSRLAFEWWQVAADNDHIFARYNVANCYLVTGIGFLSALLVYLGVRLFMLLFKKCEQNRKHQVIFFAVLLFIFACCGCVLFWDPVAPFAVLGMPCLLFSEPKVLEFITMPMWGKILPALLIIIFSLCCIITAVILLIRKKFICGSILLGYTAALVCFAYSISAEAEKIVLCRHCKNPENMHYTVNIRCGNCGKVFGKHKECPGFHYSYARRCFDCVRADETLRPRTGSVAESVGEE